MELESSIGDFLRKRGMTVSVAESCTGGLISDRMTDVAGSSDYFEGGIVSYSNKAKARHLGIPLTYIERYGAVSRQVAKRMAEGVRKTFKTAYGLSTTGVAGPAGGTKKTPVGTVFVAVSGGKRTVVEKLKLKGNRREIKEEAAERCLQLLWKKLLSESVRLNRFRESKQSEIVLVHRAPNGIQKKGRLGIFPASFNPPTIAHIALVREAEKVARLDEILVLLDIRAMDKEPSGASFEDRLTMLKKTFGKDPKISIGLSNQGLFLEKLKPLRQYYPPPISFFFIVGFDTIVRVMDRKYYRNRKPSLDALFSQCQFLVANRETTLNRDLEELFAGNENREYRERVSYLGLSPRVSFVSSSIVRKKINRRESVRGLVPSAVHRWIQERALYREL